MEGYAYEIIKIFRFQESTQLDSIAARGLERLIRQTDRDMTLIDSPLVVAYEEETGTFPFRICGALQHSGAQLERHITTYNANERRYCFKHCQKEFGKDNNKLLHERCCAGTYHKLVIILKINRQKSAKADLYSIVFAIQSVI